MVRLNGWYAEHSKKLLLSVAAAALVKHRFDLTAWTSAKSLWVVYSELHYIGLICDLVLFWLTQIDSEQHHQQRNWKAPQQSMKSARTHSKSRKYDNATRYYHSLKEIHGSSFLQTKPARRQLHCPTACLSVFSLTRWWLTGSEVKLPIFFNKRCRSCFIFIARLHTN